MDRGNFNVSSKLQFILFVPLFLFVVTGNYLISGPIFEGYLFSEQLANESFFDWAPNFLGRPLTLVPNILIYILFDSSRFGYFFISSTLLILRGSTVFLIRERLGRYTLPVSFLVMVLPLWPAVLNERFIGAQFSVNLSLIALCLYARNSKHKKSVVFYLVLSILTYPPIALVVPLSILAASLHHSYHGKMSAAKYLRLSWVFLPLAIYFLWLTVLKALGLDSYDMRVGSVPTLAAAKNLIRTLFFDNLELSFLLLLFPVLFFRIFYKNIPMFFVFLAGSLIFLSPLTYSQAAIHLNDPERVFFCVSLTSLFTSILLISCNIRESVPDQKFQLILSSYLAIGLISFSSVLYQWIPVQESNRDFLRQIEGKLVKYPLTKSILVEDYSGYLGDVRTYYGSSSLKNILTEGNSLLAAIRLNHPDFKSAIICTPQGVSRMHPAAAVFPLPTTRDCSLTSDNQDLTLRLTSFQPVQLFLVSD